MPFKKAKVYYDGSHYIAIPQENFPRGKGCKKKREIILTPEQIERKQAFETAFAESKKLPRKQREKYIDKQLKERIPNEMERAYFIAENIERKDRNSSKRYSLLWRKVNLQQWNWFVTFTFDSAKHTEETFYKTLKDTLKKLVLRHGWKYIGAWERGKDTERLHFHCICVIPENGMVGELEQVRDYNTSKHRMQSKLQNTYFLKRFGRNTFEEVGPRDVVPSVRYILKYIEKDGGRLCQGGGLKPYFISDIMDEDILCPIGIEGKKALLFDNFSCWDEGVYMGKVSPEVIEKMPKSD